MVEESSAPSQGLVGVLRRHPILSAIFFGCTLLGSVLGALYLPGEWAFARRLAAGAVAGAGAGLLCTFTKLYD